MPLFKHFTGKVLSSLPPPNKSAGKDAEMQSPIDTKSTVDQKKVGRGERPLVFQTEKVSKYVDLFSLSDGVEEDSIFTRKGRGIGGDCL